jgi:deferrochelatase/peroxidase EfeB
MAVELNKPLAWTAAKGDAATMLKELQANILKGHVRDHLCVLLLRFEDRSGGRAFLRSLVTHELVKAAKRHLEETRAYSDARKRGQSYSGTPYVGVGLSFQGYDALGVDPAKRPPDPSFERGMRAPDTRRDLSDPPVSMWEAPYQEAIHAIVLVGDKTDGSVATCRDEVIALLPESVTVLGEETGLAQRNDEERGIEHFGYIDGRSQLLFLEEDLEQERATTDGADVWDPASPLDRILVPDPRGRPLHALRQLPRLPQARAERAAVQGRGGALGERPGAVGRRRRAGGRDARRAVRGRHAAHAAER